MLEELRIASLGVIEESVLELGPGLTVVTGETGAGKTMIVTALGLLLGGRADPGAVRSGARAARVEGVVRLTRQAPTVHDLVAGMGGEVEEDRLLLGRQISAEGRSRAYAGGASVPAAALASLAEPLVAVHGQSDQHRLLRRSAQRDALDSFAGRRAGGPKERYAAAFKALRATDLELAGVLDSSRERAREADLLRFGVDEVSAAAPAPGEDATLAAEEQRLGFADELRAAAEQARDHLTSEDGSPDALGAVSLARGLLDGVRDHDPGAADLADRLAEISYLLSDAAADVASYSAGLDSDPARLAAVSERRAVLTGLTRKYAESVDEVLVWARAASARLLEIDHTDERIGFLRERSATLGVELGKVSTELSAARRQAADRLARVVTSELASLAMPQASLSVAVTALERPGPSGLDEVELLLAANAGAEARPLDKGASGGELSRVMLAIEVALAATNPVPTFVFDEVDAGVGGRAAVEVGRRLALLARHAQVLVVTHLPQVAAFADQHVVVTKSSDGSVTRSGITSLDDPGRVRELSRMLAGLEDSDTAIAHARELLETARSATR